MNLDNLTCPKCGTTIHLTEALSKEIEASANESATIAIESALREKSLEWEREKAKIISDTQAKSSQLMEHRLKDLEEQLSESKLSLATAQSAELELRKAQRKLEEDRRSLELDTQRKLDAERQSITDQAKREAFEDHKFKDAEKDKRLADMLDQIENLKRKAEQQSQQSQGEVLELELEKQLALDHPTDIIESVAKGVKGGDIIQSIVTNTGASCGKIMWETKRTKAFKQDWLQKAKDDMRSAKADICVIVTETMPKEVKDFGVLEGVWIVSIPLAIPLSHALRLPMLAAKTAMNIKLGKQSKAEEVFDYLTGGEFKGRVSAVIETFISMKEDLEREKRLINKSWAEREKQIDRVSVQLAGMAGDLSGIVGDQMPEIKMLQMDV